MMGNRKQAIVSGFARRPESGEYYGFRNERRFSEVKRSSSARVHLLPRSEEMKKEIIILSAQ